MEFVKLQMLRRFAVVHAGLLLLTGAPVTAQNPQTKEELAAIEKVQATNQKQLSQYSWQETQFISVNGETVDYRMYAVKIRADGQYQRNLVTEHTGQKAVYEPSAKQQLSQYGPYARQLRELAEQYTTLDPALLTKANNRGSIALQHGDHATKLAIENYLKPEDSVDMTFNPQTHCLSSMHVKSYLADPKSEVTIQAEFAQLPDGTNHVATVEVNSISKHLVLKLTNSFYTN